MIPTICEEKFSDSFDESLPLLHKHKAEIARYPDIDLSPDIDRYIAMEEAGILRVYVARDETGKMIGYAVFFVGPHVHYSGSLQAVQDILYVDPPYRNSMVGLRLLRYSEDALRALGVQVVMHHVKLAHPALGVILERMGHEPMETIYIKRLDRQGD